jgi:hypothetical protein
MRRAPLRRTAQRIRTARIPSTWGVPFCLVDAPVRRACVRSVGCCGCCQSRTGTRLISPRPAQMRGSPFAHPHRDWAHPSHIGTGAGAIAYIEPDETKQARHLDARLRSRCLATCLGWDVSALHRVWVAPCLGCNVSGLQPCLGCDGRCDPVRRLQRCAAGTNARTNGSSRSCVRARTSSRRRRVALVPPGLPRWGVVRDRCAAFRRPYPSGLTGPRDLRRRRLPTSSTSA